MIMMMTKMMPMIMMNCKAITLSSLEVSHHDNDTHGDDCDCYDNDDDMMMMGVVWIVTEDFGVVA